MIFQSKTGCIAYNTYEGSELPTLQEHAHTARHVMQHVLKHVMSSANCFQSRAIAFLTYATGFGFQSTSAETVHIFGCPTIASVSS
jgi:hypothetical protein